MYRNTLFWWIVLSVVVAGCSDGQTSTPTAAPTAVPVVKQLATIPPTPTVSEAERIATLTAQPLPSTPILPTLTPTPTVYVGVFLGEAPIDPFAPVTRLNPVQVVAEPTVDVSGVRLICDIPEAPAFGVAWRDESAVLSALRCPIQIAVGFVGRVQLFERGAMYFRPETGEVWALRPATSEEEGRYWYVGQVPELSGAVAQQPPSGRFLPTGEIGRVWLEVPEVRDALGFALQDASDAEIAFQRFDGGTILFDVVIGQVFALLLDGTAFGPYAAADPDTFQEAESQQPVMTASP